MIKELSAHKIQAIMLSAHKTHKIQAIMLILWLWKSFVILRKDKLLFLWKLIRWRALLYIKVINKILFVIHYIASATSTVIVKII